MNPLEELRACLREANAAMERAQQWLDAVELKATLGEDEERELEREAAVRLELEDFFGRPT
jgi:hypothetical protein